MTLASFINLNEQIKMGGFIGLAQINLIGGDLEANSKKIIDYIKKAEELGLDAVIFPRNTLLGFDMADFTKRFSFIIEQGLNYLEEIAKLTQNTSAIVGFIDKNYEHKYAILRYGIVDKIIDDVGYITSKLLNDGVEYFIKPTSIESRPNTEVIRKKTLEELANKLKRPIIEVNQVGSIDCKSYAGLSCAYDENGILFARANDFEEQLLIVNPFRKVGEIYNDYFPIIPENFSLDYNWDLDRIYKSLVQSIRDYFNKCGLKRAVLGLSGGLDSTICAVLLADALGKENVYGISMPSKLTSNESKTDAYELAKNLGINFYESTIKPMVDTTSECLEDIFNNVEQNWNCRYKNSFTPDNIQARSRAMYLWGVSNEFEACIPIATSDKSELYMGYATINGDMSGGFAPISDVTKTKLFALGRWMNEYRDVKNAIPESVLLKRPGAELAIDPNTGKTLAAEDALMPYEFLDEIIWRVENKNESYNEMLNSAFLYEEKYKISVEQKKEWLEKFYKRMSSALYKSFIMPPFPIVDNCSINKTEYYQPITSGRINYFK